MEQGFVKTNDGAYIYYEVEGEGRPIVLVHGWSCSGRFYARNVEGLKDRFKVVTLDLRGHGRSSKGTDGYTIDRLAQDVHEGVEALGIEVLQPVRVPLAGVERIRRHVDEAQRGKMAAFLSKLLPV